MKVVGVGCGPHMATEEAIALIRCATRIYGSRQAVERVRAYIREDAVICYSYDKKTLSLLSDDAVVLSTGDPLMAGLGTLPSAVVTPGISSMQLACARLHLSWDLLCIVNAHSTDHHLAIERACRAISDGYMVFLIADPAFSIQTLAASLVRSGRDKHLSIAVCEDLGYPHERIACGTAYDPPDVLSSLFCVLVWESEEV
ncbi:MAG: cobalt-precorrin-7 (C(5))-methyltransferase [Methanomicrobiales archaeon]|jgi:cobalt-precorrin-7 (C5)-methyltransferase|nr:cobalt-precorrin-7 (C(5))-methyltransferase [Methanomicrobiales archaeon]